MGSVGGVGGWGTVVKLYTGLEIPRSNDLTGLNILTDKTPKYNRGRNYSLGSWFS
jgi:hypothetical protein